MGYYIYKFEFEVDLSNRIEVLMPPVIQILSVGMQREGIICVWALVVDDPKRSINTFYVRATGQAIPDGDPITTQYSKFLGTVQKGFYVWHVFHMVK